MTTESGQAVTMPQAFKLKWGIIMVAFVGMAVAALVVMIREVSLSTESFPIVVIALCLFFLLATLNQIRLWARVPFKTSWTATTITTTSLYGKRVVDLTQIDSIRSAALTSLGRGRLVQFLLKIKDQSGHHVFLSVKAIPKDQREAFINSLDTAVSRYCPKEAKDFKNIFQYIY